MENTSTTQPNVNTGANRARVKEPIAIIGQSVLFPSSYDSTEFWSNILEGKDLISDVPASHWLIEDYYDPDLSAPDKTYGKRGGFLPYVDFDSLGWGVPPSIIEATDSTQLLALMVAKQCLQDASGGNIDALDKSNMSVILGVTSAQKLLGHMTARLQRPIWENAMRQVGLPESEVQQAAQRIADHYVPWQESTFPGLLGNVVAGRIANRLDLGGTNCVTDAACASAFSAISMAVNELYLGDSDVVIAGGADTMSDILMHMCFSKTPALSKTGDVRPFSDQADGTLLGEGIALFAFKRLADAERDGDPVYGVLKGIGSSSDGRSKSVYAPLAEGQAKAYTRAYANAGVEASTIEMVEAHGTGTKAGDAAEFTGLESVFSEAGASLQSIALGSVKSQIGHTKATAGAAGFFKALMAVRTAVLPPTIKVDRPNPNLNIEETPLYINTESRPWVRSKDHPRRAGVSAFGFGGSNFHILLEEYMGPNKAPRLRSWKHELCVYSAEDLQSLNQKLHSVLERQDKVLLSRLAWESQQSFDPTHPLRVSVVSSGRADLSDKLSQVLKKGFDEGYSLPTGIHVGVGEPWQGKKAFLFPGQGAQTVNMGSDVAQALPQSLEVWDFSAELDRHTNREPLHHKVFPKPVFSEEAKDGQQADLTKTQWAQPAIGVASMALLNVLEELNIQADCCAGHSYGELTALYYAKTFKAQHFIQVSQKRGDLMNEAARLPGAMTAVKGSAKKIQPKLDDWNSDHGLDVVIANHNSPKQSVLSGTVEDIEKIEALLEDAGMFGQRLGVATAFHSKVVAGSVAPFENYLSSLSLKVPRCPVYANRTALPYEGGIPDLVSTLSKQISSPVRFVELIENMHQDGVTLFVEVGPKNILGKLTKSILRKKSVEIVSLDRPGKSDLFGLLDGLAKLASLGVQMEWSALWNDYAEPQNFDALPKPKMAISINGGNYNKPYPPKDGAKGRALPNPERKHPAPVQTSTQTIHKEHQGENTLFKPVSKSVSEESSTSTISKPHAPVRRQGVPMSNSNSNEWLKAFQQAQQQTAAAHSAYQQAMSNAHIAYLQAAQASLTSLAALAGGQAIPMQPASTPVVSSIPMPMVSAPMSTPSMTPTVQPVATFTPQPVVAPTPVFSTPPRAPTPSSVQASPTMVDSTPVRLEKSAPTLSPSSPPSPSPTTSTIDVLSLLMDVVAEKTGYPADALDLSMSLEGDLGIDSIKRVEILSAVQEKAPELPEVDGSQMAQLQTLGEIVGFLQGDSRDFSQAEASEMGVSADPIAKLETVGLEEVETERSGSPEHDDNSLKDQSGAEQEPIQTYEEQSDSEAGENIEPSIVSETSLSQEYETVWAPSTAKSVMRWVVRPVSSVASGIQHSALAKATIAILGDEDVTSMLAIQLQRQGVNASVVEGGDSSDKPLGPQYSGVIDLRALSIDNPDQALLQSQRCFETAAQIATNHSNTPKVLIHVTQLGGDFGFEHLNNQQALTAGAAGVVRTAQQEWRESHCKNIDLSLDIPLNQLSRMLVDEIAHGGLEMDVGLRMDDSGMVERSTLRMFEQEPEGTPVHFFSDDVLVVSGGGRGVTADCIVRMAERFSERGDTIPVIVLLGRTLLSEDPFPTLMTQRELIGALMKQAKEEGKIIKPAGAIRAAKRVLACREIEYTMARLRVFGTAVHYHSVDVSDAEAVQELYLNMEYGNIAGVVHGAGVLADKKIQDKSVDDFAWVYDVKVQGMGALLSGLDFAQLKVLVFFSSVAARTGNAGQSDYAAANEVLNRVAHSIKQRHPSLCVRSIGWGPWQGGMVSPELQRHFESRGIGLIPIQEGADVFVDELTVDTIVEIVVGADAGLDDGLSLSTTEIHPTLSMRKLLEGHAFQEKVLVPMVVVLDWFHKVANALGQGSILSKCNVFNPLHLTNAAEGLQVLRTEGTLKLLDSTGRPVYGVQLSSPLLNTVQIPIEEDWDGFMGREQIYADDVLFHTDSFQVLNELCLSKTAALASIDIVHQHSEVLEMDAALQVGLRWMAHCTGSRSLPMSMETIQWYDAAPVCQIRLMGHGVQNNVGTCDLYLLGDDGQLVVRIEGLKVVSLNGVVA